MPLDDGINDAGSGGEEEFKLLDIEGSAATSYRNTASVITAPDDATTAEKFSRLAFTATSTVFYCSAIALAKQFVNPSNFTAPEASGEGASKTLPSWFARQYEARRLGHAMYHRVLRDTGALMGASGIWYGMQFALRKLRGEHDAINVCLAGTVSAGFLGATFFEPFQLRRMGIWGAVGGLLGYYGYKEQQALKEALLLRQQELEQKHMHVQPEQVRQALDPKLLQQLLQLEQQQRKQELMANMHKHGVQLPDSSSSRDSQGADGSDVVQDGSSRNSTSGAADLLQGGDDGGDQWQKLLSSAPWLQKDEGQQQP